MSFFARRANSNGGSAPDQDFQFTEAGAMQQAIVEQQHVPPPPAMADALLRRFTGMGFSDVQGAAIEAGEMLAGYKASLDRIEAALIALAASLDAVNERLETLANDRGGRRK